LLVTALLFGLPFFAAMTIRDYAGFVESMAFLGVYGLVTFSCVGWIRYRRKTKAHQAASPSEDEPAP
jgi:hypothetical protein